MFDTLMDVDFAPARVHRAAASRADATAKAGGGEESQSIGFLDLLDVINPLQHIPGVSTLYREITGDEIKAPARVLGGAIYMGPIGFIASTFNAAMEAVSGRDLGETVLAVFRPEEGAATPEVRAAAADGGTDSPAGASSAPAQPSPSLALAASAPVTPLPDAQRPALFLASAQAAEPAPEQKQEPAAPPRGPLFEKLARQGRVLPPTIESIAAPPASDTDETPPAGGFYDKMMDGLRKYEQLHKRQQAEDRAADGLRLDATL